MTNGGDLIDTVKALSADGKLSPEAAIDLTLAVMSDTLIVVREIKNDNVEIKNNVTILVEQQGKNKDEIDRLRKKSWAADAATAVLAAVGIFFGVSK